jgi:hypothetical protein
MGSQPGIKAMTVSMKINTAELERKVAALSQAAARQIPFATALALTRTAQAGQKLLKAEIATAFDKPTPWIKRSPTIERATKKNLTAALFIRDTGERANQATYLKEWFSGGARRQKPYERALAGIGILPPGYVTVAGNSMPTDAYGNIQRKVLTEVFGALKTRVRQFKGRGRRQTLVGYFVVKPNDPDRRVAHLAPGIWRREQSSGKSSRPPVPVLLFVSKATYRQTIDLPGIARKAIDANFNTQFDAALDRALRTAK